MNTFAVIQTGGKQYKVAAGDVISVEKLEGVKEGDKVTFDEILLHDNGSKTEIGTPTISGKKVEGTVEEEGKADRIHVIRFKAKSRHFKKKGHRQPYMKVKITKV